MNPDPEFSASTASLRLAHDRGLKAFTDALGLRPWREAQHVWLALVGAQVDDLQAKASYACLAALASLDGMQRVAARLEDKRSQGEPASSMIDLARLWASETDAALHDTMLSDAGLEATAASVRAASARRLHLQRLCELAGTALNQPTRSDLDSAFREIQQLKREIRSLKRSAPKIAPAHAGGAKGRL